MSAAPSAPARPIPLQNSIRTIDVAASHDTASGPIDLNLSSGTATIRTPSAASNLPISIQVGQSIQSVSAGQLLTPAELVAVYQLLHTGSQNLILGSRGEAIGGTAVIGQRFSQHLGELAIPEGVSVFHKGSSLNIAGDLKTFGSLYLTSTNPMLSGVSVSARNITVGPQGLISTIMPLNNPVAPGQSQNLSLSIAATNDIRNSGTISSGNSINIVAGRTLANIGVQDQTGSPAIRANADVNITANSIVNAGEIASLAGNVNIQSQAANNLAVNNTGGIIQASQGNVSVSATDYHHLAVVGGLLEAKAVNFNAQGGNVGVQVNRIDGPVTVTAASAEVGAEAGDLYLQSVNLTDDPIFSLQGSGTLTLASFNASTRSDVIALSNADIYIPPGTVINTNGGNVVLAAGTAFTLNGNQNCTNCVGSYTIGNGVNKAGIYMNGASINTASTNGGDAGDISFQSVGPIRAQTFALAGTSSTPAAMLLSGSLSANGTGSGNGGKITITNYASETGINGSQLTISANGGTTGGSGGIIKILGTQGGSTVGQGDSIVLESTNISADSYNGNAGSITISAVKAALSQVFVGGSISASALNNGNGGTISIVSPNWTPFQIGTISNHGVAGVISANGGQNGGNGGQISLITNWATSIASPSYLSFDSPNGNGGSLTINTTHILTIEGGTFSTNAGNGNYNGGSININSRELYIVGGGPLALTANGNGNGSGGSIRVIVDSQSENSSITIGNTAGALALSATGGSSGSSGGNGGTIYVLAAVNLVVDGAALSANPLGLNGNGASISLQGRALVDISGVINANGAGTSMDGNVAINPIFLVSGSPYLRSDSAVKIDGSILANLAASRAGGTITINAAKTISILPNSVLDAATSITFSTTRNTAQITGPTSPNVQLTAAQGGVIYFGANGIGASSPINPVSAYGGTITFDTGSLPSSSISLGGNVTINAGYHAPLASIDLTDPAVVSNIVQMQQQTPWLVGGTLIVSNGIAVGGNIIFSPIDNLTNLSAANIPIGVTVTLQNFQTHTPVNINLTPLSHSPNVIIDGVQQFVSTSSTTSPVINITSTQAAPALKVNGLLTSDKGLSLLAGGDIEVSGAINTTGILSMTLSAETTRSVTLSGSLSGSTVQIQAPGGTVNLLSNIDMSGSSPLGTGRTIDITANIINFSGGNAILSNGMNGGAGGSIRLIANTMNLPTDQSTLLRADGTGTAPGGSIYISVLTSLNIAQTPGGMVLSSTGGSANSIAGSGGHVTLIAGGDLSVDPNAIIVRPIGQNGKGGSIALTAGHSLNFTDTATLNASGAGTGGGGSIALVGALVTNPNSTSVPLNAQGNSLAGGGTISISANDQDNGVIVVGDCAGCFNILSNSNLSSPTIISISLLAGASIAMQEQTITAPSVSLTVTNGSLGSPSSYIKTATTNLTVSAAGSAYLNNVSSQILNITACVAGDLMLKANSGVNLSGPVTASAVSIDVSGSGGDITQIGALKCGDLSLLNATYITLRNPANEIARIEGTRNGGLYLNSNIALDVGSMDSLSGGIIIEDPIAITLSGNISVGYAEFEAPTVSVTGNLNSVGGIMIGRLDDLTLTMSPGASMSAVGTLFIGGDRATTMSGSGRISATEVIGFFGNTSILVAARSISGSVSAGGAQTQTKPIDISVTEGTLEIGGIERGAVTIQAPAVINTGALRTNSLSIHTSSLENSGTITSNTSILITTNSFANNGQVSAVDGINIESQPMSGLTVSGTGSWISGTVISLAGTGGITTFAGTQTFSGDTRINASGQTVMVDPGAVITSANNLAVYADTIINPNGFHGAGTTAFFVGGNSSAIGTIANPYGDLQLNSNMIFKSSGNLAIIAAGNISASGITNINLSNTSGQSGSITIMAGVDFSPQPSGLTLHDTTARFTINGPSATGGNVDLPQVSMLTNNAIGSAFNAAGNVVITANAGSKSAGIVSVGSIDASSALGLGGTVALFAPGGIIVNGAINTSGRLGAGSVSLVTATVTTSQPIQITDGHLWPAPGAVGVSANYSGLPSSGSASAAVLVNGTINTSSSRQLAGAVNILSESQLQVRGAINTFGQTQGGNVNLSSAKGAISISGNILANGGSVLNPEDSARGATGGNVSIAAPTYITIGGGINTTGGNNSGGSKGGSAGPISIQTTSPDHVGNISISGAINASGGDSTRGVGGDSGHVNIDAGSLQILGIVSVAGYTGSLVAMPGNVNVNYFLNRYGSDGGVTISTHATQLIPTNFNLTSSVASEYELPGGYFTVGVFPVINGAAGMIWTTHGALDSRQDSFPVTTCCGNSVAVNASLTYPTLSITVYGSAIPTSNSPVNSTGARNMITPGQALRLYQISTGAPVTVQLNPQGQVIGTSAQPSILTISQSALPASFSSFVLSTAGGAPAAVRLEITGSAPILTLPNSRTINGTIDFSTPGNIALINQGATQLVMPANSLINSNGTLVLTGIGAISLINSGTLSATKIVLLNPGGPASIQNSATGAISAGTIVLPSNAVPNVTSISNSGGAIAPIAFAPFQTPTGYGERLASATMSGPSSTNTSALLLLSQTGSPNPFVLTGTIGATEPTAASGLAALTVIASSPTGMPVPLTFDSANFITGQSLNISATGQTLVLNSNLSSRGSISITTGGLAISSISASSTLSATRSINITSTAQGTGVAIQGIMPSTISSTAGNVMILDASSTGIRLDKIVTVSGPTGVSMISNGAISLGSTILDQSTLTATAGSLTVTAQGPITIQNAALSSGASIILNSRGSISDNALVSYVSTGGGQINLSAGNGLELGTDQQPSSISTNGTVSLSTRQGALVLGPGDQIIGRSGIFITSTGQSASIRIGLTPSANFTPPTLIAAGNDVLSSLNGPVSIQSSGSITFTATQITANSSLTINSTASSILDWGASTFVSKASNLTMLALGNVTMGMATNVSAFESVLYSASGQNGATALNGSTQFAPTSVSSTNGTITFVGGQLVAFNASTVTAPLGIFASSPAGQVTSFNDSFSAINGPINIQSKNRILVEHGTQWVAATGIFMGTFSPTGQIVLDQSTTTPINLTVSRGPVMITAAQSITIADAQINSSGALTLTTSSPVRVPSGNNGITLSNIVINSGQVTISSPLDLTTTHSQLTSTANINVTLYSSGAFLARTTDLSAKGSVTINTVSLSQDSSCNVTAVTGIAVNGVGVQLGNLTTSSGVLSARATGSIQINGSLIAGTLKPGVPDDGVISPSQIKTVGTVSLVAAGAVLAGESGWTVHSVGGNVSITATGNTLATSLGSGNTFRADGGNIVILSNANVTGGSDNVFVARAVGSGNSSTGGGIEIGAGTNASRVSGAFNLKAGSIPSQSLGSNVSISNGINTLGAVQTNITAGSSVALTTGLASSASLNLGPRGGVIVFDAANGKSVQLDGATFSVDAYRPVSYASDTSKSAAANLSFNDSENDFSELANVFVPGYTGALILANHSTQTRRSDANIRNSDMVPQHNASKHCPKEISITLSSGEVFINPLYNTTITSDCARIRVNKGALVSLTVEHEALRVAACSGPGDVTVIVGNSRLMLHPGEEVLVSNRKIEPLDQLSKADGVGRRSAQQHRLGGTWISICDVSIVSVIANKDHLTCFSHPHNDVEKHIASRLLKTAAALSMLTQNRGRYEAHRPLRNDRNAYQTVGFAR